MKKVIKMVSLVAGLVIILTLALASTAFAGNGASYGESSECTGPGLENRWGKNNEAGTGECLGASYGESSECAGPGLQNCWGRTAQE